MDKEIFSDDPKADDVEQLFAVAEPRATAPPGVEAEIRSALQSDWERMVFVRRRRIVALAAAASVAVVALVVGLLPDANRSAAHGALLAEVERANGQIQVIAPDGSTRLAGEGDALSGGKTVRSGTNASVALEWQQQISVRLDQNTSILLTGSEEIQLLEGRLYIDTHSQGHDESRSTLRIRAADALIQHVGTQYMTELRDGMVKATVREGSVAIQADGDERIAVSGRAIALNPDSSWTESIVSTFGQTWAWAEAVSPTIEVQGQTFKAVLEWVAHETGREVYFISKEARLLAEAETVKSFARMEPATALQVLILTSDLRAQVDGGRIVIDLKQGRTAQPANPQP